VILTTDWDYAGQWVAGEIGKLWHGPSAGRAIGWISDEGVLVAGVSFTNFDGVNVWLDCAAQPKTRWLNRRGLWAIFHYVFEQLGCVRCSVAIPENNEKSRKLVEGAGFKLEARLERAAPEGTDMLVYRMFREECKWLGRK
jgi:RimJ/RimL family protein N-acetyltransferase